MRNKVIVRDALLTDTEGIYAVEKACFNDPWSINMIFESLFDEKCHFIIITKGDKVIAAAGFQIIVGQGHILTMGVLPAEQKKGYGDLLIRSLLEEAEKNDINEITLEVRVSNISAISLYEKYGFKSYGIRKKYYIDNDEDAYIMWRIKENLKEKK